MGNATSSVADIKKRGDTYNKAVRAQRASMGGLTTQMSSKRFKKADPFAEQWKVRIYHSSSPVCRRLHVMYYTHVRYSAVFDCFLPLSVVGLG